MTTNNSVGATKNSEEKSTASLSRSNNNVSSDKVDGKKKSAISMVQNRKQKGKIDTEGFYVKETKPRIQKKKKSR